MLVPEDIEEERRLCYVGMTRAMDQLILTRAVYRRRYGTELPEASVPSRFLEEVPGPLIEELGNARARGTRTSLSPPREATTSTPLTIHTKMRIRARHGTRAKQPKGQLPQRNRRLLPDPTIRLRTLPSSSPAAERSSRFPRWRLKNRPASVDFVPARRSGIRNTAKVRCISAKAKAKKRRLRYNFHASA